MKIKCPGGFVPIDNSILYFDLKCLIHLNIEIADTGTREIHKHTRAHTHTHSESI